MNETVPDQPPRLATSGDAALTDVTIELEMVEHVRDVPIAGPGDLAQQEPELGYYEAALHSLREALETRSSE